MVRAGTPLIVTGNLYVSLQSKSAGRQAGIDTDDKKRGLREWVELAHSGGSLLIAQLNHGGRQMVHSALPGKPTVSASSVREPLYGTKPRPLRADEIPGLVNTFAAAAARAREVGFDGVQIHAAHGYLLSQFLTPHTNRRNDEYGGSLDNRMRLLREVFQAIRARVGDDFPILLKMNGTDMLPLRKGATTAELVRVATMMADEGIDAVEISRGHYESWPGMVLGHYKGFISGQVKEGSGTKMSWRRRGAMLALAPILERTAERLAPGDEGFNLPQAEQFTAQLGIPVICVGGFHTTSGMESAIESGRCDAVSAARAFIADPYLFKNAQLPVPGRPVCGYCNGCIARFGGKPIDCYNDSIRARKELMLSHNEPMGAIRLRDSTRN
jgi:2,4-dienoyl-CoA reductase-like NADH-dependent reductase (Old Yellow Enzyme family)